MIPRIGRIALVLAFSFQILVSSRATGEPEALSLDGTWRFSLDPRDEGASQEWFKRDLPDACSLPGSTDENGFGYRNLRPPDYNILSRLREYVGAAWCQRDIQIPEAWRGLSASLFLERCHWETRAWVDETPVGMWDSLCVPHVYDLGLLSPGSHRLTIRVDNTLKYDMGAWAHSTSEQTQTNWNGIIGRIELRPIGPVRIQDLQIYPDPADREAIVRLKMENATQEEIPVQLEIEAQSEGANPDRAVDVRKLVARPGATEVTTRLSFGKGMKPWDEFSPSLYRLTARMRCRGAGPELSDETHVSFGMRELGISDRKQFTLNGRSLYLRGTLECCIFPETGYPSMDVAAWLRIFRIAQSYGLNHLRFHSWCPPEAAFEAADQTGFLLHVEAPQWVGNVGQVPDRDHFIEEEVDRILWAYGNHPSFGFLCMGNELAGDPAFLQKLVKHGKDTDPRHLYTPSTWSSLGAEDQYRVMAVRGIRGPETDHDFRDAVASCPVPLVSHEVGQWTVYPNLAEIPKYTGALRPRNFELIASDLQKRGLIDQAPAFTAATGAFMIQLYKEEIEVLLRTPQHAGFQLLDLHDFPGQGTALIGALDPFWDSKGFIEPRDYRRFCGPTVPLLRMPKRTYLANETFIAQAEIVHYGVRDLDQVAPAWRIEGAEGRVLASGAFSIRSLPTGDRTQLGEIRTDLSSVPVPSKLKVIVGLMGTEIENDWAIWVYPADLDPAVGDGVEIVQQWDSSATDSLAHGRKVLFLAPSQALADSLPGSFLPVFWSPIWFKSGAQTMSILCDPNHPALTQFPTSDHTDWQWADLLRRSNALVLDELDPTFRPVVQVIDNFSRNHRLANLFEAKVGPGRLMVCTIDLTKDLDRRPEARQLRRSIMAYMASPEFEPKQTLTVSELRLLFKSPRLAVLQRLGAKVLSADSDEPENPAGAAIDGDPNTCWHTQWKGAEPGHPHELVIDLQRSLTLQGVRVLPRQDMLNGRISRYELYVGDQAVSWGRPAAVGEFANESKEQEVQFNPPAVGRYLRLLALSEVQGKPWASVAEIDVICRDVDATAGAIPASP